MAKLFNLSLASLMLLCITIVQCFCLEPASADSKPGLDEEPGPDNIADWFSRLQALDMKGEEGIASMLVSMAALQALSTSLGQQEDISKLLAQSAKDSMQELGQKLSSGLGSQYARLQKDAHGAGQLHINLAGLLDLESEDLDARLAAAAEALGATVPPATDMNKTDNSNTARADGDGIINQGNDTVGADTAGVDGSGSKPSNASMMHAEGDAYSSSIEEMMSAEGVDLKALLEGLDVMDVTAMEVPSLAPDAGPGMADANKPPEFFQSSDVPQVASGVAEDGVGDLDPNLHPDMDADMGSGQLRRLQAVTSVQTTERLIRNGTVTITSRNRLDNYPVLKTILEAKVNRTVQRKDEMGKFLNSLLGVDWEKLQKRIQDKLTQKVDNKLNRIPRIKAYNKLEQIFQIVVEKLTGGDGLGEGCTPYTFNGGGARLPETIIFPSFSISQTTGNCVLIPEFIGNAEYPGQWSLANSRVACLGPSSEYLLVPAFKRSAGTSSEAFACPTCRNEFSIGPAATITLAGDSSQVIKFKNKAEFLAALKTNKTFGWGRGGLDAELQRLRAKLQAKQAVLAKYTHTSSSSSLDGKLSTLLGWLNSAWSLWQSGHPLAKDHSAAKGKARTLLEEPLADVSYAAADQHQGIHDDGAEGMPSEATGQWGEGLEQAYQELPSLLLNEATAGHQHDSEHDDDAPPMFADIEQDQQAGAGAGWGYDDEGKGKQREGWEEQLEYLLRKARTGNTS